MRNYQLPGVFTAQDGTQVTITDKSIYLCNNSQQVDYSGDSKDTVKVLNQTLVGSCVGNKSKEVYQKLQEAAYYRLENPSVLRLYGPNNSEVLELNKVGKWDGKIPVSEGKNASSNLTNSIQSNGTSLSNVNASISAPSINTTNSTSSQPNKPTNLVNNTNQINATKDNPPSSNQSSQSNAANTTPQPVASTSLDSS